MTNLQTLYASAGFPIGRGYPIARYCGINNEGIENLNLKKLFAANNSGITNVNHMSNLKILDASQYCGLNNEGIKDLNLIDLIFQNNTKITNRRK